MKTLMLRGTTCFTLILFLSHCRKDYGGNSPTTTTTDEIRLASSAQFGSYLTNNQGIALYIFAGDADGNNKCAGDCATTWPPLTADLTTIKFDTGLSASDFSTIIINAGVKQVTYKGWPLYTYAPLVNDGYGGSANIPETPGATAGEAVNGERFIAKPDYTIMLINNQLKGSDGINYQSDYTTGNGNTTYFTDGNGRTLYTFIMDSFNINKFTNPDESANSLFPIYEKDQFVLPSTLDKTLFGSIIIGGKKQMTYHGWPLYYFSQDDKRGSNKGITVPAPGVWPVAVKDIEEAKKPAL